MPPPAPTSTPDLLRRLRALGQPERAAFLAAGYALSAETHRGVPVPAVRRLARDTGRALRPAPAAEVFAVTDRLLAARVFDARCLAYEVLAWLAERDQAWAGRLTAGRLKRLARHLDCWPATDLLATRLTGPAWRDGRLADSDLLTWARSRDPWRRRLALVSTVALNLASRGGSGDSRRTLLLADRLARDPDPNVQKGLSWALRSLIDHDCKAVESFLHRHDQALPARVRREVRNKLSTGRKSGKA
ncbi:MAG: DNA alkylation repair protein [Alphaproteobacteria bacterium]